METLNSIEIRVLGCLMEKERATPDYYPLSMNGLVNACNQKSNRFPVVSYTEDEVAEALDSLSGKQLILQSAAGRVVKYDQRFSYHEGLSVQEAGLMCVLFVRGAQTAGELRGRTARLAEFESLDEVKMVLSQLAQLEMVTLLSKEPGRKEARYCHLLAEEGLELEPNIASEQIVVQSENDELAIMKGELSELKQKLRDLQSEFAEFKQQFE